MPGMVSKTTKRDSIMCHIIPNIAHEISCETSRVIGTFIGIFIRNSYVYLGRQVTRLANDYIGPEAIEFSQRTFKDVAKAFENIFHKVFENPIGIVTLICLFLPKYVLLPLIIGFEIADAFCRFNFAGDMYSYLSTGFAFSSMIGTAISIVKLVITINPIFAIKTLEHLFVDSSLSAVIMIFSLGKGGRHIRQQG